MDSTGQDKKVSGAGKQLPAQLVEFRFVKLKAGGKIPVEKWGNGGKTYAYNDPELLSWISQGGNYGVVAGPDHVIVACDYPLIEKAVESRLPPTFTVRSPRHKTKHFYYRINKPLTQTIMCIPGDAGDPIADIRHSNGFVVGPGCIFEGYGVYEIADDRPVATITEEELLKALGEFVRARGAAENAEPTETHGLDLSIVKALDVLGVTNLDWVGNELVGPHPMHGSTGGHNFHVNVEKNAWHCFRAGHESGGGPLELLAVMMGLVKCEDCKKPSPLKTDKALFKEVLAEAKKRGLVEEGNGGVGENPGGTPTQQEEKMNLFNLARRIVKTTPIVTDIRTYQMYRWNGKVWVDDAEGVIHKKLVEACGENYKPYHLTTLTQLIQGMTFIDEFIEPSSNLICFKNGVLNLNTMELSNHDPAFLFRNYIRTDYDPNADCPKFKKWLEEVLPDPSMRECVQELFGYCFLRDYPIHKLFFLVGTGRNGKGTLIRTLQGILGGQSLASVPIHRLAERFQVTNLIGKLVNVDSEPKLSILNTAIIKQLTGQDSMSAEIKGKQRQQQFTNYAKIIILANRLPPVGDNTVAWWERVIIVEFPNEFIGERQRPNIEEEWLNDEGERNGIARWALEGLQRLLKNGRFTQGKRMEETINEYRKWSNSVGYFIESLCSLKPGEAIEKRRLYDTYKEFCLDEDLEPMNERAFSQEVSKLPKVTQGVKKLQGKATKVWLGITLKQVTEVTGVTDFYTTPKPCDIKEEVDKNLKKEDFYRVRKTGNLGNSGNQDNPALGGPGGPSGPGVSVLLKNLELNELNELNGGKEFYKSIEVPASPASPDSTRRPETCAHCQEYQPDYSLCALDGERKDPGFSCSKFMGKPPAVNAPNSPQPPPTPPKTLLYKCKCGAGPWRDCRIAKEHLELCKGESGHELQEVRG